MDSVKKPAWLTDLSLGLKESYDDNVLLVSGHGAKKIDSIVTTLSPKIGFNFAPLLDRQEAIQPPRFRLRPRIRRL